MPLPKGRRRSGSSPKTVFSDQLSVISLFLFLSAASARFASALIDH